ncbi:S-adenosyl-L-methionine-dependent methyltransferase [Aspergillus venezuelensis]
MVGNKLSATGPGKRIFDVGYGNVSPAIHISSSHDVHVTNISVSSHQIEVAQAQAKALAEASPRRDMNFQLANVLELPCPDASYDGAYATESLCHIDDKAKALAQIARVLRPWGKLVIMKTFLDELLHMTTTVPNFNIIRENVIRGFGILADGMRQLDGSSDDDRHGEMLGQLQAAAADLMRMSENKFCAYASIIAVKRA